MPIVDAHRDQRRPRTPRAAARPPRSSTTGSPPACRARDALDADEPRRRAAFGTALAEPGWIGAPRRRATAGAARGWSNRRSWSRSSGRACAPGPYVPTAIVAALLQRRRRSGARRRCCPRIAAGELTGAVALDGATLVAGGADRRRDRLRGRRRVVRARRRRRVGAHEVKSIDLTRRLARIDLDAARRPRCDARPPAREPHRRRACACSRRCCSRPKPSASRSGASTPRPSTRRCACSSAGRSASSRA